MGEKDKFHHMCASLEGPARHVLWELPLKGATTADLERLLQVRFGTQLQAESFKAKLRMRCRAENETLQDLYQDISRLIQLAHPGEGDKLVNHIGIESFINALNDRDLELEILKLKPADMEEAVSHAVRLEVLTDSVNARSSGSSDRGSGRTSARSRTVFAVSDNKQEKDGNVDLLKHIAQLEKELKQAAKGSKGSSSKKTGSKGNGGLNLTGRNEPRLTGRNPAPVRIPTHAIFARN